MNVKIRIICVGRLKEQYFKGLCEDFSAKIKKQSRNILFDLIEVNDESIPENCSPKLEERIKSIEADRILSNIEKNDAVCALCIEGTSFDDRKLKRLISEKSEHERRLVFIIGGSLGLHESVVKRADYKISFSDMTFPHQLMRVILLERLSEIICDM